MLFRQEFRGGHQGDLTPVGGHGDRREQGDRRLAATHIALQQAVHGMGLRQIRRDLAPDSQLGAGQRKRQRPGCGPHSRKLNVDGDARNLGARGAAQHQPQLQQIQLL